MPQCRLPSRRVIFHHEVAKQLSAIPPDRRQRILDDLRELAGDPFRGLVKLRNERTYQ
jgi:mRNA-degrading endonuclease RelE of RelBE toxin-antitoxin system